MAKIVVRPEPATFHAGWAHPHQVGASSPDVLVERMASMGPLAIDIRDLKKSWPRRVVLDGVSLQVPAGHCVAIVGLSGCGKSTLVRIVVGLEQADEGTVCVTGPIGFVPQDPALFEFDELTLGDNLTFATDSSSPSTSVEALLAAVGLEPSLASLFPGQLSGGQRRRGALARALAFRPSVLVYDEPTAGLDPLTARRISMLIRSMVQINGLTSLVVTHDFETAVHVADGVVALSPHTGRLIEILGSADCRPGIDPGSEEGRRLVERLGTRLDDLSRAIPESATSRHPSDSLRRKGLSIVHGAFGSLGAIGAAARLLLGAFSVARTGSVLRSFLRLFPGSLALSMVGGAAAGAIIAFQSVAGLVRFEASDLLPEVATGTIVREIAPLLTGLLLAGRLGASIASEIGSMSLSGQLDVLKVLGHNPGPFLVSPLLWAVGFTMPLVTLAAIATALLGLFGVSAFFLGLKPSLLSTGISGALSGKDLGIALSKSILFGLAIVVISYRSGASQKGNPQDLGDGTTQAVVRSSIAVVVLDCVLARLALWF